MILFYSFRKWIFSAAGLACLIFSGCSPEARLAEAADNGEVQAQYELAVYYSELDPPHKTKSFEWMKRAAISRYAPAMKKLAEYYLHGYGTPVNYSRVAEWLTRCFEKERNSVKALEAGQAILSRSVAGKDLVAGLLLCKIALTIENQNGDPTSETALSAAKSISSCIKEFFYRLLVERNYADAEKLLQFVQKIYGEYPSSFHKEMQQDLQRMHAAFIALINGN